MVTKDGGARIVQGNKGDCVKAESGHATDMICIQCPMGCRLRVVVNREGVQVTGHACRRGAAYARDEFTCPRRTVTTTVRTDGNPAWLPVRTRQAVPRQSIPAVLAALSALRVQAPLSEGDVVLEDAGGTGIPVIAGRPLVVKGS